METLEKIEIWIGIDEETERVFKANGWSHIRAEGWETVERTMLFVKPTFEDIPYLDAYREILDDRWIRMTGATPGTRKRHLQHLLMGESARMVKLINQINP